MNKTPRESLAISDSQDDGPTAKNIRLERALAKANADKAVLVGALKAFIEANANGPADKWIQRMVECDVKARAALSQVQA